MIRKGKGLYRLRLAAARHMAVELSDRGENHAANTIAGLLAVIEELDPQEPGP